MDNQLLEQFYDKMIIKLSLENAEIQRKLEEGSLIGGENAENGKELRILLHKNLRLILVCTANRDRVKLLEQSKLIR